MFRNLLNRLTTDDPAPARLSSVESEVAIAALLVRVARADNAYHDSERARIDAILARFHNIGADEAAERRAAAEMIEAEAPDTVRFTRQIKDRVVLEERQSIISAMWEVALVDSKRDSDEERLIRLAAGLLGVTDRDSALARQKVQERLDRRAQG
ncbi:TerB family tellurite resistance protein [Paracoccus sp. TK19116]|uniref:TerB family tellurite resistance protein n=1 Tax=Paracoccus albicereus TaxID=2922394 RepID=A0ABT1MSW1_9RHOB|nr:TerB family tellurite resistance protein [Paracoccus albicereus]MCQ0970611.1 TerB family tellurite resistance protein [Paracoccus albicereus]